MSDPRKDELFERLAACELSAEPAGAGGVCILLPGCCQVTLAREQAIRFSQDLLRAIAAGEPSWEGFD